MHILEDLDVMLRSETDTMNEAYTFFSSQVIKEELFRNLGLAFVCVAIVTLPLIASLGTCIFVCITVVLTLVKIK